MQLLQRFFEWGNALQRRTTNDTDDEKNGGDGGDDGDDDDDDDDYYFTIYTFYPCSCLLKVWPANKQEEPKMFRFTMCLCL